MNLSRISRLGRRTKTGRKRCELLGRSCSRKLRLEPLEDRRLLAVIVTPLTEMATTETGGQALFQIRLSSPLPLGESSVVYLESKDPGEGTISPGSVEFAFYNWSDPRTIVVTGVNDSIDDGDIDYEIDITQRISSTVVVTRSVSLTNRDDGDTAGMTVAPTAGLLTAENGNDATFTIALDSEPTASVTIGLNSSDTSEGTVQPASVLFTANDWDSPRTVTVTGVNDDVDDGNTDYAVHVAATSSDPKYNGRSSDVSLTNEDDDTARITVTPTSEQVTTEDGAEATFTIVLESQPTAEVTVDLNSSDTTEGTVSPARITFDADDWDSPRAVTVTGVDDDLPDGGVDYTIEITATSIDTNSPYHEFDVAAVAITNLNLDPADFGDAPAPYPTLWADGGPAHLPVDGFYLGAAIDAELDGQPDAEALGDDDAGLDDEDGVVMPASVARGAAVTLPVTVAAAAKRAAVPEESAATAAASIAPPTC